MLLKHNSNHGILTIRIRADYSSAVYELINYPCILEVKWLELSDNMKNVYAYVSYCNSCGELCDGYIALNSDNYIVQ